MAGNMQRLKETDKNTDGVWGIRARVWLLMFATILVCLTLLWFQPDSARTTALLSPPGDIPAQQVQNREWMPHRSPRSHFPAPQMENGTSPDLAEVRLDLFEQMSQDRRSWLDAPQF
jgi:hypothetical protein